MSSTAATTTAEDDVAALWFDLDTSNQSNNIESTTFFLFLFFCFLT
jgi:hypothetical protein